MPLSDLVRYSSVMFPNSSQPDLLFEYILASEERFNEHVGKEDLNEFTGNILKRISQQKVTFDHLKGSLSTWHGKAVPSTDQSFLVLKKIMNECLGEPVVDKILA